MLEIEVESLGRIIGCEIWLVEIKIGDIFSMMIAKSETYSGNLRLQSELFHIFSILSNVY